MRVGTGMVWIPHLSKLHALKHDQLCEAIGVQGLGGRAQGMKQWPQD